MIRFESLSTSTSSRMVPALSHPRQCLCANLASREALCGLFLLKQDSHSPNPPPYSAADTLPENQSASQSWRYAVSADAHGRVATQARCCWLEWGRAHKKSSLATEEDWVRRPCRAAVGGAYSRRRTGRCKSFKYHHQDRCNPYLRSRSGA